MEYEDRRTGVSHLVHAGQAGRQEGPWSGLTGGRARLAGLTLASDGLTLGMARPGLRGVARPAPS